MHLPAELNATLVLVRHGESTWIAEGRFQGRQDPPLSALGERQAALVGQRLAQRDESTPLPIPTGMPIGVWHSPLARATQTAQAIADAQRSQVSMHPEDGLTEIAQGEWEGQPHSVVSTRWAAELTAWRRTPVTSHAPGGELLPEARQRVGEALTVICDALAGDGASPFAAGASAAPRGLVPGYPTAAGASPSSDPWAVLVAHDGVFRVVLMTLLDIPTEHFWSYPFNLCAITVVTLHDGVAALRAHNLSEHLAPIAAEARAAAELRGDRRGAL